jgi:hypothetical protein
LQCTYQAAEALAMHEVLTNRGRYNVMTDAARRLAWPKPNELSYSSPPGPQDAMWPFLLEKMTDYPQCAGKRSSKVASVDATVARPKEIFHSPQRRPHQ